LAAEKVLPALMRSLEHCDLCHRKCGVNRLKGEKGHCASGRETTVYRYAPHHGEEPPLSGRNGSGAIFFSRCNMNCVYCQNHRFSQTDRGKSMSSRELSAIMLELQDMGCHNINLVSPTHFVPLIVEALKYAFSDGLGLPVVYNTGGYDSEHVIRALEGLVDIYLPDMRYSRDLMAEKYSVAPDYVSNNRDIVKEMYRQVGDLRVSDGIALKGLIIRLLLLPGGISGTEETLRFISGEIGKEVHLSVMSQYYPAYKAASHEELAREISDKDYSAVTEELQKSGLSAGWVQPFEKNFDEQFAGENFSPSF